MVRTMKRTLALATVILMLMLLMLPLATAWGASQNMYVESGMLNESDAKYIDSYLTSLSEELEFDIIGVLMQQGYNAEDLRTFADDFYDENGFGYGHGKDGCIFVVDMGSRQMTLVTTGYGIQAITDYGEELVYDNVTDSLVDGDFVTAFTEKYADKVLELVVKARQGDPVDIDNDGEEQGMPSAETAAGMGGIAVAAGAGVGLASSQSKKSKLKSVKKKYQANSYERRGSLVLTRKQDRFLYSNVAVTHRPKQNDNGGGKYHGGGGTTIHMGSSGVRHGGGHGRGF